jgi:maltooligosyltrehalose synthase
VALVAVPRLSLGLAAAGSFHLRSGAWGDTALELPQALCDAGWCDVLGGAAASAAAIRAADLFRHWPVALLSRLAPRSESNLAASPSRNR